MHGRRAPSRGAYIHGTGARERRRLEAQAHLLGGDAFLPPVAGGSRVLEVGSGTGAVARRVARRLGAGNVVGLDRSAEQAASARALALDIPNLAFEVGLAQAIPHPDASFQAAYCRFLLEHVADPTRVLLEMARVVAPGGWVCALEWEPDSLVMQPPCPNALALWDAIYALQASTGVDPRVGRTLHIRFSEAGLVDVRADTLAWSVTAGERASLQLYVSGAREVIRQTRQRLIDDGYTRPEIVEGALREYRHLLQSPSTFISHFFRRAVGVRS